ncbi:MAG: hypothetical protein HEQ32_02835 [Vampirovibrio sp.]
MMFILGTIAEHEEMALRLTQHPVSEKPGVAISLTDRLVYGEANPMTKNGITKHADKPSKGEVVIYHPIDAPKTLPDKLIQKIEQVFKDYNIQS